MGCLGTCVLLLMAKMGTISKTEQGLHNSVDVGRDTQRKMGSLMRPVQHQLKSHMFVSLHYDAVLHS